MNKKAISLLLCLLLMVGMTVPAFADEADTPEEVIFRDLTISTAEEFLEFSEKCRLNTYSENLSVTLNADIDLTGYAFSGVPIFCGIFDGNNHKITGLDLTIDGSMQGFFRYLTSTAEVRNLRLSGNIQPGGSKNEIGAIAGRNEGIIQNCVFVV